MKFLVFGLMLSGCAAGNQYCYNGPNKFVALKEYSVDFPDFDRRPLNNSGFPDHWVYFDNPLTKVVEVSNPFDVEVNITVVCAHTATEQVNHINVQPHSTSQFLVTTKSMYRGDTLCTLTDINGVF